MPTQAAAVVRRIFQSVLAGKIIASIAKALRAEKIPIPSEHWKRTGEPVRAAKYTDPYAWSATTIGYILKRPEYMGRKVLGKTVCENYKTKSSRKTAPEEQVAKEARSKENLQRHVMRSARQRKELMAIEKTGADLTPEEVERLAVYRRKKADQQRARREGKKSDQPKKKVS